MRVLIIEDETAASENLVAMLKEVDENIIVEGVLESVQQTVRWLNSHTNPDLMFMDIHLSDGSAFTLFDEIEVQTPIVFTTAYDQYALDAFSVNSVDYLLKPIKTTELQRALNKFKRWNQTDVLAYLEHIVKLRPSASRVAEDYKNTLLVPVKDKLVPVSMDSVVCIYSSDRKTQIYCNDGKMYNYTKSLDTLIGILDPKRFFRANKQYIVSKAYVKEIVIWFDNRLLLRLPIELTEPILVSKNKAAEFKNWMMS